MATRLRKQNFIKNCLSLATDIVKLPLEHMWIDYDREADVIYLSFRRPQRATKTIEADEDILIRKDGNKIVGLTILNASSR
ncbi:MAG: DUF2283 domain-containing protein [Thermodesulfobacteriota bacterium]